MVNGQDVASDSAASAAAAGGQLGVHRLHHGPQVREVQAVERRHRQPGRVESNARSRPRDQPRLQPEVQLVLAPADAPGWVGRYQRDGSRGVARSASPLRPQVHFIRRPGEKDESVQYDGRSAFKGGPPGS